MAKLGKNKKEKDRSRKTSKQTPGTNLAPTPTENDDDDFEQGMAGRYRIAWWVKRSYNEENQANIQARK